MFPFSPLNCCTPRFLRSWHMPNSPAQLSSWLPRSGGHTTRFDAKRLDLQTLWPDSPRWLQKQELYRNCQIIRSIRKLSAPNHTSCKVLYCISKASCCSLPICHLHILRRCQRVIRRLKKVEVLPCHLLIPVRRIFWDLHSSFRPIHVLTNVSKSHFQHNYLLAAPRPCLASDRTVYMVKYPSPKMLYVAKPALYWTTHDIEVTRFSIQMFCKGRGTAYVIQSPGEIFLLIITHACRTEISDETAGSTVNEDLSDRKFRVIDPIWKI